MILNSAIDLGHCAACIFLHKSEKYNILQMARFSYCYNRFVPDPDENIISLFTC